MEVKDIRIEGSEQTPAVKKRCLKEIKVQGGVQKSE